MRPLGNRTLTVHEAMSQGRYHLGAPTLLLRYKTASFLSEGLACSKQMFSSHALTKEVLVDQIATSSGLATFLELFVSSGSLYRCASAVTNAVSLPKLFVAASHRMNCIIWVHAGAYPLPFSLEEQKQESTFSTAAWDSCSYFPESDRRGSPTSFLDITTMARE